MRSFMAASSLLGEFVYKMLLAKIFSQPLLISPSLYIITNQV